MLLVNDVCGWVIFLVKFVVVDDDESNLEEVKNIIREVTFNLNEDVKIATYSKYCKNLADEINNISERKIYILDIELDDKYSGIQIAENIRLNDWESEIIFMTYHDKMFETVYRKVYEVFDFIEKFYNFKERLKKDIKIILNKNFDNKLFVYKSRNVDLKIYLKNILYIYRDKEERKVVVVTDNNKFIVGLGVQEVLDLLDSSFALVHRACIVNKNRVQKYNWSDKYFVLDTGEEVNMLSKKYKKDVSDNNE